MSKRIFFIAGIIVAVSIILYFAIDSNVDEIFRTATPTLTNTATSTLTATLTFTSTPTMTFTSTPTATLGG